jgi:hypothetical protein
MERTWLQGNLRAVHHNELVEPLRTPVIVDRS